MISDEIKEIVNTLFLVCKCFGFKGRWNPEKTESHWQNLVDSADGNWMKVAKYKLAAFFSYHVQQSEQTMPIKPFKAPDFPGQLAGGRLGRFITTYLRNNDEVGRLQFLKSIKDSKKGMPRASAENLRSAEQQLINLLTGLPRPDNLPIALMKWGDIEDYPPTVEPFISVRNVKIQLRRTVSEIFKGKTIKTSDRIKHFFPSTSANYINSRSKGGVIGTLFDNEEIFKDLRQTGGYLGNEQIEKEESISGEYISLDDQQQEQLEKAFQSLYLRILQRASQEVPNVEPVALAESLKIRVITKGPPFMTTAMRNVWKFIHNILRKHPAFELIGKPIDEIHILKRMGAKLMDDEFYLSGDYAAATDNLKSWVSNEIADAISDEIGLYPIERRLFKTLLTGHMFGNLKQTGGQLMGSIMSFPILCIANAAMTRWAAEIGRMKPIKLHDAPMTINGDDVLLKTNQKGDFAWKIITSFCGLEESVGKTYRSKTFLEMNSTLFERGGEITFWTERPDGKLVERKNVFHLIKYVNMGLVKGYKRSGGKIGLNGQTTTENIGERYREMLRLCPRRLIPEAHQLFINHHRDVLEKVRVPWYMPEWIGGAGLTGYQEPSELDKRIGRKILLNWKRRSPISIARHEAPWKIWELAEKALPEPFLASKKTQGTEDYTSAVGRKCVDLLFDSRYTLDDLLVTVQSSDSKKIYVRNAKLWKPTEGKLPEPLTQDEINFRPVYKSYSSESPFLGYRLQNVVADLD